LTESEYRYVEALSKGMETSVSEAIRTIIRNSLLLSVLQREDIVRLREAVMEMTRQEATEKI
jgi:hypothetical protein